jgi:hypothetical protein
MSRKTFNVEQFKNQVNDMLAQSTSEPEVRQGMIVVLERMLHDTGNYHGFRYLEISQVPEGFKPGINLDPNETGMPHTDYNLRFKDTDSSRVSYY